MPIAPSDIVKRGSVAAAAGDTTAQTTPGGHRGDQVATTVLTSGVLTNLFPDITASEALAGGSDYQCFFALNNHATLTLKAPTVQVLSETAGGAACALALDNIGPVAKGSASAQAATIATKNTAPTGVSAFSTAALALSADLAPGQVQAVWVRRTWPANTSATNLDGVIVRILGDTAQ